MYKKELIEQANELLPQTQCGECGYAGCKPYAEAMVNNGEAINKCPPGGKITFDTLNKLLNRNGEVYTHPQTTKKVAVIEENFCIGCTICIKACPVDAIIGSAKKMHAIIESECTGCELCIEPCPMDCIDLKDDPIQKQTWHIGIQANEQRAKHAKLKYEARNKRIYNKSIHVTTKVAHNQTIENIPPANANTNIKTELQQALLRAQQKNNKVYEE